MPAICIKQARPACIKVQIIHQAIIQLTSQHVIRRRSIFWMQTGLQLTQELHEILVGRLLCAREIQSSASLIPGTL